MKYFVYRCYGRGSSLLYVGCSVHPRWRVNNCHKYTYWGASISRMTISKGMSREMALDAERRAIKTENPRYNRAQRMSPSRVPKGFAIKDNSKDWCVKRRLKMLGLWRAGYGPMAIARRHGVTCGCINQHLNKALRYLEERRAKRGWQTRRRANAKPA